MVKQTQENFITIEDIKNMQEKEKVVNGIIEEMKVTFRFQKPNKNSNSKLLFIPEKKLWIKKIKRY